MAVAALTLVELLVCVAIMGALLAMLVPSYRFYREEARSIQCTANLRHIYGGLAVYAADYGGLLPPKIFNPPEVGNFSDGVDLPSVLAPYGVMEQAFHCPKDIPGSSYGFEVSGYGSSYVYAAGPGMLLNEGVSDGNGMIGANSLVILAERSQPHRWRENRAFSDGHVARGPQY